MESHREGLSFTLSEMEGMVGCGAVQEGDLTHSRPPIFIYFIYLAVHVESLV